MNTQEGYRFTDRKIVEAFMGYADGDLPEIISWNDVMPVVEKIESVGYYTDIISYLEDSMCLISEGTPQGDGGKFTNYIADVRKEGIKEKLNVTWQACVQFIQWYNQNKTT